MAETMPQRDYDIQALTGAAEYFEELATGKAPGPLAFAQAIRRAVDALQMEKQMEADFAQMGDIDLNSPLVDASWERFKALTSIEAPQTSDHLAEAAPEMLAALRLVSGLDLHHEVLRAVDAAISKATQP